MSGVRLEVQWSPAHPEKFITWGTEIFLYEVVSLKDNKSPGCKLSDVNGANLLATNSNHQYVKCVDIFPQPVADVLLAIGQANGKVVLTTFRPTSFDALGLSGRELVPNHARQCNAVAWNPVDPNLLVAGLDKYRNEHSVLLWDVLRCSYHTNAGLLHSSAVESARPIAEFAFSETAHSLAWFNNQSRSLAIGANNKQIKLVDVRDTVKAVNGTQTKAVYGLVVDPHSDNQMASFCENQICVWDTRSFEKPVLTLTQSKPVTKILWCPTRHNLLASLMRDSSMINLHDIQHTFVGNDELEPCAIERNVRPGTTSNFTSFSWHPVYENKLLAITLSGSLTEYIVPERITLNWSPTSQIMWTHGRRNLKSISEPDSPYVRLDDISLTMKKRAIQGYGLKDDLWQNAELSGDEKVKKLWQFLHHTRTLVDDGSLRGVGSKVPGIRAILKLNNNYSNGSAFTKSDMISLPWCDFMNTNICVKAKIYRSEDRDKALLLCGLKFERDSMLVNFLESLQAKGEYSRAAALAVFNLKLRLAVDILSRGATSKEEHASGSYFNIVAMALSGFSENRSSMWQELCLSTRFQLEDSYLRAMFSFLTAENDSYEVVLNEAGVLVEDRVAFACTFLSDQKLCDYLRRLTNKLVEEGDLAGILLTGASMDGIQLLQKFLDNTNDIQSISVLAIHMFSSDVIQETVIQDWISSYRALLDGWRLWNQRAQFDIVMNAYCPGDRPPQQMFVSCNFCGKSISAQMQTLIRCRGTYPRTGSTTQKLKMSACPQCRKPLPRCAICLVNMGTASGFCNFGTNSNGRTSSTNKLAEFSSWFTWCQTCRHGGHVSHMIEWFKDHYECPVTACTCRCMALDAAAKITSIQPQRV